MDNNAQDPGKKEENEVKVPSIFRNTPTDRKTDDLLTLPFKDDNEATRKLKEYILKLTEKKQEIQAWINEKEKVAEELKKLKQEETSAKSNISILEKQRKDLSVEVQSLTQRQFALEQRVNQLDKKVEVQQKVVVEHDVNLTIYNEMSKFVAELPEKIKNLEAQKKDLAEEVSKKSSEVKQATENKIKVVKECEDLSKHKKELEEANLNLEKQKKIFSEEILQQQKVLENIKKEIEQLSSTKKQLEGEKRELEEHKRHHIERNRALETEVTQRESKKNELDEKLKQLETAKDTLQNEVIDLFDKFKSQHSEFERLQADIYENERKKDKLEQQIERLEISRTNAQQKFLREILLTSKEEPKTQAIVEKKNGEASLENRFDNFAIRYQKELKDFVSNLQEFINNTLLLNAELVDISLSREEKKAEKDNEKIFNLRKLLQVIGEQEEEAKKIFTFLSFSDNETLVMLFRHLKMFMDKQKQDDLISLQNAAYHYAKLE